MLGLVIGLANISAEKYLEILRETAGQLRKYSEWFLGKELLSKAVSDHSALVMQSQTRTVLFMDIRGFTKWNEPESPGEVVAMLNSYYEAAEKIWTKYAFVKTKLTADEVMIVFPSAEIAVKAAMEICIEANAVLSPHGLSAGIGLHLGHLVEGLLGSKELKMYDVIGDTVNTSKRICNTAKGNEILISQTVFAELGNHAAVREPHQISVKGKAEPLTVYALNV